MPRCHPTDAACFLRDLQTVRRVRIFGRCVVSSRVAFFLAGASLFSFAGCAENKMTRQNYDTIIEGASSKLDVKMTMGDQYEDHGASWEYEDEKKHVTAYFYFNDKDIVIRKQWWDANKGDVEGQHPNLDRKD